MGLKFFINHCVPKTMWKDPIVEEIRRIRSNIGSECNNDFDKIFALAIEAEKKLSNRLVSKPASNSQMSD